MSLQPDTRKIDVTFTDMAYGGDAVGRDPETGITVFGWPTIEGESATVEIVTERPNLLRGLVTTIKDASLSRTAPFCPYFGVCGGCQWQHIEYGGQLRFKHSILQSQLERIAGLQGVGDLLLDPIASPHDYRYRNSSHFAIDPLARKLAYFQRDTHSVLPVDECPISNQAVNEAIPLLNSMLALGMSPVEAGEDTRGLMRLWKVAVRSSEATGQTVVVFFSRSSELAMASLGRGRRNRRPQRHVTRPEKGPVTEVQSEGGPVLLIPRREIRRTLASWRGEGVLSSLMAVELMDDGTINLLGETRSASSAGTEAHAEALTGTLLGGRKEEVSRRDSAPPPGSWVERLGNINYWVPPQSFFQVNSGAAELMLAEVGSHLPARMDLLVDAHAGVGTFALAFAGHAGSVIGMEPDASAVAAARWTARAYGITNLDMRQGRAEVVLPSLPEEIRPDVVILDPPRSGCHPALLSAIAERRASRIVYVSCDPSTLARDIKILSETYALKSARVIDMFPQTYHIETIAVLDLR